MNSPNEILPFYFYINNRYRKNIYIIVFGKFSYTKQIFPRSLALYFRNVLDFIICQLLPAVQIVSSPLPIDCTRISYLLFRDVQHALIDSNGSNILSAYKESNVAPLLRTYFQFRRNFTRLLSETAKKN